MADRSFPLSAIQHPLDHPAKGRSGLEQLLNTSEPQVAPAESPKTPSKSGDPASLSNGPSLRARGSKRQPACPVEMQVQLPSEQPRAYLSAAGIELGRNIATKTEQTHGYPTNGESSSGPSPHANGGLAPAWQPASPTSVIAVAFPAKPSHRPVTPQRPHPGSITIPSSPPLDQPLFSAYPIRTPQTPRRGKERASDAGSLSSPRSRWAEASTDAHAEPASPYDRDATLKARRRGSIKRNPSHEAIATESGQQLDRPNPLGHTWGRPVDPAQSPLRRQRRATISNRPEGLSIARPAAGRHSHHERGLSVSVDGHDTAQRRQEREARGQYTLVPLLPPGAMPAANPSATGIYDLSVSQRYTASSASALDASPGQVLHIPGRSSSIDLGNSGQLTSSPPQILKMDLPPQGAFTYVGNADAQYTLHSVSSQEISRPLVSPALSERRMNLLNQDFFSSKAIIGSLGLSPGEGIGHDMNGVPKQLQDYGPIAPVSPAMGNDAVIEINPVDDDGADVERRISLPSTIGASSAATSRDFALSSASTSLSRSAKSGKEGGDRDGSAAVQHAVEDPFTSEAKVIQTEGRLRKADQRKFILVELVETEVGYAEHLRDLVEIYLPQLAALPILSESQRQTIVRNLGGLAAFHADLSGKMVEVLRGERLGCESTLLQPVDEVARIERLAGKLCAVFVQAVSIACDWCNCS